MGLIGSAHKVEKHGGCQGIGSDCREKRGEGVLDKTALVSGCVKTAGEMRLNHYNTT